MKTFTRKTNISKQTHRLHQAHQQPTLVSMHARGHSLLAGASAPMGAHGRAHARGTTVLNAVRARPVAAQPPRRRDARFDDARKFRWRLDIRGSCRSTTRVRFVMVTDGFLGLFVEFWGVWGVWMVFFCRVLYVCFSGFGNWFVVYGLIDSWII